MDNRAPTTEELEKMKAMVKQGMEMGAVGLSSGLMYLPGRHATTEEVIELAKIANRSRGSGAGRTVWDMAKTFDVALTDVTWRMLDTVKHRPIVIIRPKTQMRQ